MNSDTQTKPLLTHFAVIIYLVCWGAIPYCAFAASPIKAGWKVDAIANSATENNRLLDKDKQFIAAVSKARLTRLQDTLSRIQNAAGITTELWLVQLADKQPNAFATSKDGRNYVLVSLPMLDLLADDMDAYAFLFGHEIAHNVKQHSSQSQNRRGRLRELSTMASATISAKTGYDVRSVTDFGADLIGGTYSRDQEREADELGFSYMATGGFDPRGAVRLQRDLLAASGSTPSPILSPHPGGVERIANLEKMIAALPSPSIARTQTPTTPVTPTVGLVVVPERAEQRADRRQSPPTVQVPNEPQLSSAELNQRGEAASKAGRYAEAVEWYRKAAEHGSASTQYTYGLMYMNGVGVKKDDAQAVEWYRRAAARGHPAAQNDLGEMYAQGRGGLPRDDAQAAEWYLKAAAQGNLKAINNLERLGVKLKGT